MFQDAADCEDAYDSGSIRLRLPEDNFGDRFEIGNDVGDWAGNEVCNDPRFVADPRSPLAVDAVAEAEGHDKRDCFDDHLARLVWPMDQDPGPTKGIAFGDDSGRWDNDGECDDPRFWGEDVADTAAAGNVLKDATDCRAAVREGTAHLVSTGLLRSSLRDEWPEGLELGDDSGERAFDGECEDPRFEGVGMAETVAAEDILKDATDCGRALLEREARFRPIESLEFGDNQGPWAGNGVCDDPRFVADPRRPLAADAKAEAKGHDATECLNAYLARLVWPTDQEPGPTQGIAFGDDSGKWASDGECDDPRFWGGGVADNIESVHVFKDESDCRAAVRKGTAHLVGTGFLRSRLLNALPAGQELGDDSGEWAFDGECDDPRFEGEAVADIVVANDIRKDATDCGRALLDGGAKFRPIASLDFGDDNSVWAENEVCNDPRFVADPRRPLAADADAKAEAEGHDERDCLNAYLARRVWPTDQEPGRTQGIAFGDDSGERAFDGECDDPRFEGEGVADTVESGHVLKDASDCRDAVRKSSARLESGRALQDSLDGTTADGLNLGDDSGEWAFDGECDDPRFEGEGVADAVAAENVLRDATDCGRALRDGRAEPIRHSNLAP